MQEIKLSHDNHTETWRIDRLMNVYSNLTKKENIIGLHDWKGTLVVSFTGEIHIETILELQKEWDKENEYELIFKAV